MHERGQKRSSKLDYSNRAHIAHKIHVKNSICRAENSINQNNIVIILNILYACTKKLIIVYDCLSVEKYLAILNIMIINNVKINLTRSFFIVNKSN
jgi:hypothetical protein